MSSIKMMQIKYEGLVIKMMENVYDQFIEEVTAVIHKDYGVNIIGKGLEMDFVPSYLEEENHNWKGFMCSVIDPKLEMKFFFIANTFTGKVVEIQVISLDSQYVV
jgi:hypothetical protein